MIKYLGSKRLLVPRIAAVVQALPHVRTACDFFAGTTRVARALKSKGCYVISNDLASYSEALGRAYIATDRDAIDIDHIRRLLGELMALRPCPGYVTRTFCEDARYFQPDNGARIDAIRPAIDRLARDDSERSILLTSLLLAADRVDSTTGLQMAYLKQWSARSYDRLELRLPELLPGPGAVTRCDANALARDLDRVDVAYLDPPYNQHSFFSNYHVWETLVRNDEPATYGVARKRIDCRTTKSRYNGKRDIGAALEELVTSVRADYVLVSFSTEGYLTISEIERILSSRGYVASCSVDYKRYVGAQIGVYNPQGQRVGEVSHLRNREHLFLAGPNRSAVEAAIAAAHLPKDQPATDVVNRRY